MIIDVTKKDLIDLVRSKFENSFDLKHIEVRSVGDFVEISDEDILLVLDVNMIEKRRDSSTSRSPLMENIDRLKRGLI